MSAWPEAYWVKKETQKQLNLIDQKLQQISDYIDDVRPINNFIVQSSTPTTQQSNNGEIWFKTEEKSEESPFDTQTIIKQLSQYQNNSWTNYKFGVHVRNIVIDSDQSISDQNRVIMIKPGLKHSTVNTYAEAGIAERSHASSSTTYGIGTGSNYGHVKLTTSTSSNQGEDSGIALAASVGKTLKTQIDNIVNSYAPIGHASSSTTYGIGTDSNYGHVKVANTLTSTSTTGVALSANMGRELKSQLDTKQASLISGTNIRKITTGSYEYGILGSGSLYIRRIVDSNFTINMVNNAELNDLHLKTINGNSIFSISDNSNLSLVPQGGFFNDGRLRIGVNQNSNAEAYPHVTLGRSSSEPYKLILGYYNSASSSKSYTIMNETGTLLPNFLTVARKTTTIGRILSGDSKSSSFSVAISGKKAIAIVGHSLQGEGSTYLLVNRLLRVSPDTSTCYYYYSNRSNTATGTDLTLTVDVLYLDNE